jgi:hypothetical protein
MQGATNVLACVEAVRVRYGVMTAPTCALDARRHLEVEPFGTRTEDHGTLHTAA